MEVHGLNHAWLEWEAASLPPADQDAVLAEATAPETQDPAAVQPATVHPHHTPSEEMRGLTPQVLAVGVLASLAVPLLSGQFNPGDANAAVQNGVDRTTPENVRSAQVGGNAADAGSNVDQPVDENGVPSFSFNPNESSLMKADRLLTPSNPTQPIEKPQPVAKALVGQDDLLGSSKPKASAPPPKIAAAAVLPEPKLQTEEQVPSFDGINNLSTDVTNYRKVIIPPKENQVPTTQVDTVTYFRSGIFTGPSSEIGGSSAYHIDTKFHKSLTMEQKVAMMDAMATGYAQEGRRVEFSNEAVAGEVWNTNASAAAKAALLKRAEAAHSHSLHKYWTSVDYYVPIQGESRSGESVKGVEVLLPKIPGTTIEYGTASNYGNFVTIISNNDAVLKTGHGANSKALPGDITFPKDVAQRAKHPLLSEKPFK